MNYRKRAAELSELIISHRRTIHANPEVGMDTWDTADFIEKELIKMGYSPRRCAKTGITATVGKSGGKVFLLRADMDALPLEEESSLSFCSRNSGAAHCCGHDLHTAMLLGAAQLLKENEESLEGMVKLMFQPGEEVLMGARAMIDDGLLENPIVNGAFGIHVNALYPSGKFLLFDGMMTSASNGFTIKVKGHAAHGARPEESIDPINAMLHIYSGLQAIQTRELSPEEKSVMSICAVHAGTTAGNAIPDTAEMKGTLRTTSKETRDKFLKRIEEISSNIGKAFKAGIAVETAPRYSVPLVCDHDCILGVKNSIDALLGDGNAVIMRKANTASEDFSFVAERVPSAFIILGAAVEDDVKYGQHHPKVRYDEGCLAIGAAVYAQVATDWLKNNQSYR